MSQVIACPLCQEDVPVKDLAHHQKEESSEIVTVTINLIKRSNPTWIEADGACAKCWSHYRNL